MRPFKPVADVIHALLRNNRGATAVEYGLIVALIVISMFVALKGVATKNAGMWNYISQEVLTKG